MINSCKDCKSVCCKTGPGPYDALPPREYLDNFGDISAYNTKCMALSNEGGCNLWGTPQFPIECRVYVCQTRSFTKKELSDIEHVFERECE